MNIKTTKPEEKNQKPNQSVVLLFIQNNKCVYSNLINNRRYLEWFLIDLPFHTTPKKKEPKWKGLIDTH